MLVLGILSACCSGLMVFGEILTTNEQQEFTISGCKISNLKVTPNTSSAKVITLDYHYSGLGKPPIQLVTLVDKKGDAKSSSYFQIETVQVATGDGSVSIKVTYLREPEPMFTDRIRVQFFHPISKYLLGTATFTRPISWGNQRRDAVSSELVGAESPIEVQSAGIAPASELEETQIGTQAAVAPPSVMEGSFSALSNVKRAPWQEHLTLGAGDVLNFSLYGEPELTVKEVFIGPDGRISYLEAQGLMATGLTVDELRQKFDDELGKYRRSPRTMISPVALQSKKYYMLGRVAQKGVFTLDRPITVIEAIARARGFETGMSERNVVELADLSHSFIARRGQRVPVDFEKLFLAGDLSQNIPLEPDDYLYFPATDIREFYVLGEVKYPGAVSYSKGASTIGAIAQRGGFTEKAWKGKVLVVRGSLNHPETFVIDVTGILSANTPDFKLQPRDIIYVNSRPWVKAEELLDVLASAFVQAAVITWTGGNIGSIIK